jgi:hypothetical protein
MQFDGAVIKEQGVTFAVVVVKEHVLNNKVEAREVQAAYARYFPGMPVVLMAQNHRGVPTYWGRPDIARFLAGISLGRIPWKRYTAN